MQLINNLTDQADQLTTVTLLDGSALQLEFIYRGSIQRWTLNLNHPTLAVNNLTLVTSPNMLRSWRNIIPFGLSVTSVDGQDPYDIEDFVLNGNQPTPRIQCYVLSPAEILTVEADYFTAPALSPA